MTDALDRLAAFRPTDEQIAEFKAMSLAHLDDFKAAQANNLARLKAVQLPQPRREHLILAGAITGAFVLGFVAAKVLTRRECDENCCGPEGAECCTDGKCSDCGDSCENCC